MAVDNVRSGSPHLGVESALFLVQQSLLHNDGGPLAVLQQASKAGQAYSLQLTHVRVILILQDGRGPIETALIFDATAVVRMLAVLLP